MDAAMEISPMSPFARFVRWLRDYEGALDRQPIDRLEGRVADLERQIAVLLGDKADRLPRTQTAEV